MVLSGATPTRLHTKGFFTWCLQAPPPRTSASLRSSICADMRIHCACVVLSTGRCCGCRVLLCSTSNKLLLVSFWEVHCGSSVDPWRLSSCFKRRFRVLLIPSVFRAQDNCCLVHPVLCLLPCGHPPCRPLYTCLGPIRPLGPHTVITHLSVLMLLSAKE